MWLLTRNGPYRTTPTIMINNTGITLDSSVHGKVAAVASVGDVAILEQSDGHFNGLDSVTSIFQDGHANPGGIITGFEVVLLITCAMISSSSMYVDCAKVTPISWSSDMHGDSSKSQAEQLNEVRFVEAARRPKGCESIFLDDCLNGLGAL